MRPHTRFSRTPLKTHITGWKPSGSISMTWASGNSAVRSSWRLRNHLQRKWWWWQNKVPFIMKWLRHLPPRPETICYPRTDLFLLRSKACCPLITITVTEESRKLKQEKNCLYPAQHTPEYFFHVYLPNPKCIPKFFMTEYLIGLKLFVIITEITLILLCLILQACTGSVTRSCAGSGLPLHLLLY